jgi:ATP-binding cassette subfamily G (WHITE) protein 2
LKGPTGCGKSSLLDILADRKDRRGMSGRVLVDGLPRHPSFKYTVGYVVQEDIFSGTLTVRENLLFSANLRLPKTVSEREKNDRVSRVIADLGLESCADTRMGTELLRGVSGGEKKRTCIGMEMILSPKILFLDEPTTGKPMREQSIVDTVLSSSKRIDRSTGRLSIIILQFSKCSFRNLLTETRISKSIRRHFSCQMYSQIYSHLLI